MFSTRQGGLIQIDPMVRVLAAGFQDHRGEQEDANHSEHCQRYQSDHKDRHSHLRCEYGLLVSSRSYAGNTVTAITSVCDI